MSGTIEGRVGEDEAESVTELVTALAEQVARLQDVERARSFLAVYAAMMDDAPQPDEVATLFLPDAELATSASTVHGTKGIADFYAGALQRDPSAKRHFITNVQASWVAPGRVRLESYFLFTSRRLDGSGIGWGRYEDIVDTSGPTPRFARKAITIDVGTDLEHGWHGPEDAR